MITDDDLDRMWRDGLTTAADGLGTTSGVRSRVAARVRHRRNRRRVVSAGAVAALAATTVVGAAELQSGRGPAQVTTTNTTAPPLVPHVVPVDAAPGGTLKIEFPGHELGNPASITLPSGLIRFVIHVGGAGHVLRIEGAPNFEANLDVTGETITKDVLLDPGRVYVMYCAIPGHRDAGESVIIVVR